MGSYGGRANLALLVLRAVVGVTFLLHGYPKVSGGVPGFAGFLTSLQFPVPGLLAWLVAALEFLGGLALILGLLTQPLATLFAAEMLVTTLRVKVPRGVGFIGQTTTGWELDFLLLGSALALALLGGGAWSLDALWRKPRDR